MSKICNKKSPVPSNSEVPGPPAEPGGNGCVDSNACNYDSSATISDGSCIYLDDCGECGGDNSSCCGCMDPTASNYNPDATIECDRLDNCKYSEPSSFAYELVRCDGKEGKLYKTCLEDTLEIGMIIKPIFGKKGPHLINPCWYVSASHDLSVARSANLHVTNLDSSQFETINSCEECEAKIVELTNCSSNEVSYYAAESVFNTFGNKHTDFKVNDLLSKGRATDENRECHRITNIITHKKFKIFETQLEGVLDVTDSYVESKIFTVIKESSKGCVEKIPANQSIKSLGTIRKDLCNIEYYLFKYQLNNCGISKKARGGFDVSDVIYFHSYHGESIEGELYTGGNAPVYERKVLINDVYESFYYENARPSDPSLDNFSCAVTDYESICKSYNIEADVEDHGPGEYVGDLHDLKDRGLIIESSSFSGCDQIVLQLCPDYNVNHLGNSDKVSFLRGTENVGDLLKHDATGICYTVLSTLPESQGTDSINPLDRSLFPGTNHTSKDCCKDISPDDLVDSSREEVAPCAFQVYEVTFEESGCSEVLRNTSDEERTFKSVINVQNYIDNNTFPSDYFGYGNITFKFKSQTSLGCQNDHEYSLNGLEDFSALSSLNGDRCEWIILEKCDGFSLNDFGNTSKLAYVRDGEVFNSVLKSEASGICYTVIDIISHTQNISDTHQGVLKVKEIFNSEVMGSCCKPISHMDLYNIAKDKDKEGDDPSYLIQDRIKDLADCTFNVYRVNFKQTDCSSNPGNTFWWKTVLDLNSHISSGRYTKYVNYGDACYELVSQESLGCMSYEEYSEGQYSGINEMLDATAPIKSFDQLHFPLPKQEYQTIDPCGWDDLDSDPCCFYGGCSGRCGEDELGQAPSSGSGQDSDGNPQAIVNMVPREPLGDDNANFSWVTCEDLEELATWYFSSFPRIENGIVFPDPCSYYNAGYSDTDRRMCKSNWHESSYWNIELNNSDDPAFTGVQPDSGIDKTPGKYSYNSLVYPLSPGQYEAQGYRDLQLDGQGAFATLMLCCTNAEAPKYWKIRECIKDSLGNVTKNFHSIRRGSKLSEGVIFSYPKDSEGNPELPGCHEVWEEYDPNEDTGDIELNPIPLENTEPCPDPTVCLGTGALICNEYNPCDNPTEKIWLATDRGGGQKQKIYDFGIEKCLIRGDETKAYTEVGENPCIYSEDFQEISDCDDLLCKYAVQLNPCDGSSVIYAEDDPAFVKDDVVRITLDGEEKCYTVGELIRSSSLTGQTIHSNLSPSSSDSNGNDLSCEDYPCVPPEVYRELEECSDDNSSIIFVKDSKEEEDSNFTEGDLLFIESEEKCFTVKDRVNEPDIPSGSTKRDSIESEVLPDDCAKYQDKGMEPCVDIVRELTPCDDTQSLFYIDDSRKSEDSDYKDLEGKVVMLSVDGEEKCHTVGERRVKDSNTDTKTATIIPQEGVEELKCDEVPCIEKILELKKCKINDNDPDEIIFIERKDYPDLEVGSVYRDNLICYTVEQELIKTDQTINPDPSRNFELRQSCDKCDDPIHFVPYIQCSSKMSDTESDTFWISSIELIKGGIIDSVEIGAGIIVPKFLVSSKNGDKTPATIIDQTSGDLINVDSKCFIHSGDIQSSDNFNPPQDRTWNLEDWNNNIKKIVEGDDYSDFCMSDDCIYALKFVPDCPSASSEAFDDKDIIVSVVRSFVESVSTNATGETTPVWKNHGIVSSSVTNSLSLYNKESITLTLINLQDLVDGGLSDPLALEKAKKELGSENPVLVEKWVKDIEIEIQEVNAQGIIESTTFSGGDFSQSLFLEGTEYKSTIHLKDIRKPFWTDFKPNLQKDDIFTFNHPNNQKGCFVLKDIKLLSEVMSDEDEKELFISGLQPESDDPVGDPCVNYCATPTITATPFPDLSDCPDDEKPEPEYVYIKQYYDFEILCEHFDKECPTKEVDKAGDFTNLPVHAFFQDVIAPLNKIVKTSFIYRGDLQKSGNKETIVPRIKAERDYSKDGQGIKRINPIDETPYESYEWRQINYEYKEDENGKKIFTNNHACINEDKIAHTAYGDVLKGIYVPSTESEYSENKEFNFYMDVLLKKDLVGGSPIPSGGYAVKAKAKIFKIPKGFHKKDYVINSKTPEKQTECIMGEPVKGNELDDRGKLKLPSEVYLNNCHLNGSGKFPDWLKGPVNDPQYSGWSFDDSNNSFSHGFKLVPDSRPPNDICWRKDINGIKYPVSQPEGFQETTDSKAWTSFESPEGGLVYFNDHISAKSIKDLFDLFADNPKDDRFEQFLSSLKVPANMKKITENEPLPKNEDLCCHLPLCPGDKKDPKLTAPAEVPFASWEFTTNNFQ